MIKGLELPTRPVRPPTYNISEMDLTRLVRMNHAINRRFNLGRTVSWTDRLLMTWRVI